VSKRGYLVLATCPEACYGLSSPNSKGGYLALVACPQACHGLGKGKWT